MPKPQYVALNVPAPAVDVERRGDGVLMLRSPDPLRDYPDRLTDRLFETAAAYPERVLIAQRIDGGDWRRVTYGEAARFVRTIAGALRRRGLGPDRPIVILSGSSIEHGLLTFAALHAGVPYASVTPAYSLLSTDYAKLRHVVNLLTPGLVFVQDAAPFANSLAQAVPADVEIVAVKGDFPHGVTGFDTLLSGSMDDDAQAPRPGPDDLAKFLFTSGSTGMPKAVAVTHRMWCANQQMFIQAMPFLGEQPPVFVDWLPWHHTSGGNQTIGMTLYLGGTLYIDDGKPTREGMAETVRNLRDVTPTTCFSVPKGFAELMPRLAADPELARRFFSSVGVFFYSGAALPPPLLEQMDTLSERSIGKRVPVMSAYGATETSPFSLIANWPSERPGLAGLPMPGVDTKLVPFGDKYEVRVAGPHVTPGYWRQPDLTAKLFDEEGYLCLGDSVDFLDPERPERGLAFSGRIAEDFKLTSGTWVNVGQLRDRFLSASGLVVRDIVVTGENRDEIGALVFLSPQEAADMAGDASLPLASLARHPAIRAHIQSVLDTLAEQSTGSSTYIARVAILPDEPSAAAGEVTDKGSIGQRATLANRRALVDSLYDAPASVDAVEAASPAPRRARAG
ncbi:feruloyl-CoA synthase [Mesorhizobium australicum]|uniref:Feruloyl-CoA synthase n=1 Tax=Mesorhizobium australicum TaxID=536018 RepID=A0A1X7PSY0_9HYPH|nr:feruloyl-CoA synthase [Mesorhizobium australicum]SMH54330.1 feruloyl-CoA synthase [Mesorhizobium australicum]